MQNKRLLLQRMLLIYVTFLVVLAAGLTHSLWPSFSRGYNEGAVMGEEIVRSWTAGTPREIFLLHDVPLAKQTLLPVNEPDSLSGIRLIPQVQRISLIADLPADPDVHPMRLAFSSVGGNPWYYVLLMFEMAAYVAIVVLMFLTIHSIRRSIREERTLGRCNVWYLRSIGFLTIFAELSDDFVAWRMRLRAAELLQGTQIVADTSFTLSYATIVMGILVLFTAEVFAIGRRLSEEQRLTI